MRKHLSFTEPAKERNPGHPKPTRKELEDSIPAPFDSNYRGPPPLLPPSEEPVFAFMEPEPPTQEAVKADLVTTKEAVTEDLESNLEWFKRTYPVAYRHSMRANGILNK